MKYSFTAWVAKDNDGKTYMYSIKPKYDKDEGIFFMHKGDSFYYPIKYDKVDVGECIKCKISINIDIINKKDADSESDNIILAISQDQELYEKVKNFFDENE